MTASAFGTAVNSQNGATVTPSLFKEGADGTVKWHHFSLTSDPCCRLNTHRKPKTESQQVPPSRELQCCTNEPTCVVSRNRSGRACQTLGNSTDGGTTAQPEGKSTSVVYPYHHTESPGLACSESATS